MRAPGTRQSSLSPLYETMPIGGPPQGNFINAALVVTTRLPAPALLHIAHGIEERHGRIRLERFGPRTLDVDVLWVEAEVVDIPGLQVPHPRLCERAFALKPLLDVAPDAIDPRNGLPLQHTLSCLSTVGVRCLRNRARSDIRRTSLQPER